MIYQYKDHLKSNARQLRAHLTDAECLLWSRLRRKQLHGVPFYRQKPLGHYIVDFYAPSVRLVIEVDGGQHFEEEHQKRDAYRDETLKEQGLKVLRFHNLQVLKSLEEVLIVISNEIVKRLPC